MSFMFGFPYDLDCPAKIAVGQEVGTHQPKEWGSKLADHGYMSKLWPQRDTVEISPPVYFGSRSSSAVGKQVALEVC